MGMLLLLFYRLPARVTFYIFIGLLIIIPGVTSYVRSLNMPDGMELMAPYFPLFQSNNPLKVLWFGLVGTYQFEVRSPGYLITVHFVMLACFMLGLTAQKVDFFNRLAENKKYIKRIFWGSLIFALVMVGLFITTQKMKWTWMKYYSPTFIFILSNMIFFVSALCWLYVAGKLKAFFRAMQTIGKMTLTNYITQNVLALFLFSGFGLGFSFANRIHYGYYLLFGFVIYVAQVYFSKWWLSHYHYGPIEWAWRQLNYNKRLPIKKQRQPVMEDSLLAEQGTNTPLTNITP
jgi:uncharacterized protein